MLAPIKWFLLALQFATAVPTPPVRTASEQDIQRSVVFFPVIGILLGLVLWAVDVGLLRVMPRLPAAVLALAVYTLATGALHLDGLMDTADAIGSRRSRDTALDIMKDSRVGAMGVVAGIFAILAKLSALTSLSTGQWAPFVVVPMMSRCGMVWSMAIAPPARNNGLGALFARKIPGWTVVTASCLCAVVCALVLPLATCLWTALYSIVTSLLFTGWMVRRFGGTTGDTFGALNELMECAGWYVFVCLGG